MKLRSLIPSLAIAIAVLVVALVVRHHPPAAGRRAAPVATTARRVTVSVSNYAFEPQKLTVRAGTRVTWTNHDNTAHTATADAGAFDTGNIEPGKSRSVVLTKPGTYAYHCAFHAFMTATITVIPR